MVYDQVEKLKEQYKSREKWYSARWHYIEGCIVKAYLDSYEASGCESDYRFAKGFVDKLYNAEGLVPAIDIKSYNIDQIRMAANLFALYHKEGDPKYKNVMDMLYRQLASYPRTKSGSFWHKENYPDQVWLDGLYMGQPFYVQYMKEFIVPKDYSDTLRQFRNVDLYLYNPAKRLYSHAYDESRQMFWCSKDTGQSPNVWGRAVGWFAMALVDVLELLEGETADTGAMKQSLQRLVDDMLRYRHPEGMWYQVVDQPEYSHNYLETSGTLMMAYAILKAARLGFLPKEYAQQGVCSFDGTISRYLREEDGEVLLGGICRSAGLGKKPESGQMRDGSLEYYTCQEQVVDNNGHGVAPLLMAYNEIRQLGR